MCANFYSKWTTLNFLAKVWGNCPIVCDFLFLITLRVLQRAEWKLKSAGWRWIELDGVKMSRVEVDGVGWRWVHSLVTPIVNNEIHVSMVSETKLN